MIYLYLSDHTIKLLSLSKNLFGQYSLGFFQKNHTARLLEKGRITTVDLVASAVKEALTLATPSKIKEKEVCLILPQESFEFDRYDVPSDISETAVKPFIEDKIRAQTAYALDEVLYDYLLIKQEQKSKILFFAQHKEVFSKYYESLKLLGLTITYIVPDTVCYFSLFAKTLRKEKKENILYVFYQDKDSYGYLYDSLGLLKNKIYHFDEDIEDSLHKTAATFNKDELKLNRIILSGTKSENIRQDLFTKKVGVWTNPLIKIITNFYQDYLQLLVVENKPLSLLDFDACFGAFVAYHEHNVFSIKEMTKKKFIKSKQTAGKIRRLPIPIIQIRDIIIFFISFTISFILIFFFSKTKLLIKIPQFTKSNPPTTAPSPTATPTISPTPIIDKTLLKIKVLNGTGKRGRAADVRDILTDKGYGEIITDNADNFDYEKTELQIKDDQKTIVDILKKDLADHITLDNISSLDAKSTADAILIVGADFE